MIIGVTGFNASGKGEFCKYLESKGFVVYSLSDIIRDELRKEGKELALREEFGNSILADKTIEKFEQGKNYVIDSIRNPAEIEALRKNKDFKMVFIGTSSIKLRYERAKAREREGESVISFEEFKAKEEEEMQTTNSSGQQLTKCREIADFIISNEFTLDEFHKNIDELLEVLDD